MRTLADYEWLSFSRGERVVVSSAAGRESMDCTVVSVGSGEHPTVTFRTVEHADVGPVKMLVDRVELDEPAERERSVLMLKKEAVAGTLTLPAPDLSHVMWDPNEQYRTVEVEKADSFTITNLPTDVGFYEYEGVVNGNGSFRFTKLVRIVNGVEEQVRQEPPRTVQMTGKWGYAPAHPASIYPSAAPPAWLTAPGGDWVGTDEAGYTSAQLKARIMPVSNGQWWAKLGERWISDDDGWIAEFPTARMAREQLEQRREAERG
jgi:hypothetical protein